MGSRCTFTGKPDRPLGGAAATFPAGANQIRLAAARDFSGGGGGGIQRDLVNGGTSHY